MGSVGHVNYVMSCFGMRVSPGKGFDMRKIKRSENSIDCY